MPRITDEVTRQRLWIRLRFRLILKLTKYYWLAVNTAWSASEGLRYQREGSLRGKSQKMRAGNDLMGMRVEVVF